MIGIFIFYMFLYYVQHTSSLAFLLGLKTKKGAVRRNAQTFSLGNRKEPKKRKENELVSSSLSLSFPPNEEGRCINFLVYGVVFISSRNLDGIFNAVLCLVFLESCSSTGSGMEYQCFKCGQLEAIFVYLTFPAFQKTSLPGAHWFIFSLVPASGLSFLSNNYPT